MGPGIGISQPPQGIPRLGSSDPPHTASLSMYPAPHSSTFPVPCQPSRAQLTDAHVLVIQLGRAVAVEAQTAVLAVLASRVVLAADAGHHVEEVDVAAAVGVAIALAVWAGRA